MKYRLEFRDDVLEWLLERCHPDPTVVDRVNRKFMNALRHVAVSGPAVQMPHLRKLKGFENLYEVRVGDTSGWYRIFCGFGPVRSGGETVVALSYAIVKHERNPPRAEYQRAAAAVTEHLAEFK